MKVNLNVGERLQILQMLHQKGTFLVLRTTQRIIRLLSLTAAEEKEYEFTVDPTGTQCRWNKKGQEETKEFDFPDSAIDLIKKRLTELDEKGELSMEQMSLYEKFFTVPA